MRAALSLIWVLLLLTACSGQPTTPVFHAVENPKRLSEWQLLPIEQGSLTLGKDTLPYTLNTSLFTDYAHKLRTIWAPEGGASYKQDSVFEFPVGTIITKTFYYPRGANNTVLKTKDLQPVKHSSGLDLETNQLIETRLLVHRESGWEPLSYVWNADQSEAFLKRTGKILKLTLAEQGQDDTPFVYVVPNVNQCAGCHAPNNTTREISPIGPKGLNLNGDYAYADGTANQLDKMHELGMLANLPTTRLSMPAWQSQAPVDDRARAYLDSNCAHCHNPVGPADTSGLHLNYSNTSQPHLGVCKNAVAAGSGTGGRKYDITPGAPHESIMLYRMASTDPGAMMPELGRSLAHREGVALIEEWIREMDGNCG